MKEIHIKPVKGISKDKLADKRWRLNNLYFITTKKKRLIPVQMNDAQLDFFTRKKKKNYILKARQLGFSTFCLINLLDDTIFNKNTKSAIVAHEKQKVVKLFEIIKLAFEHLPDELKPRTSLENRNELYFPDINSKIYVTVDTRGETVHNLHVSELAFIAQAETKLAATLESVPEDGSITFETTANGMANYAYDEWTTKDSEFEKFFYPWMWDKNYQIPTTKSLEELQAEYRPMAMKYNTMLDIVERFKLSPAQFNFYISKVKRHKELVVQEYPTTDLEAFISSGKSVFNIQDLNKHEPLLPIDRKWSDLLIWEMPMTGFRYTMGVDTCEGVGKDNAVIQILNAHTGFQAAELAVPNLKPDELASYALEIARWYNNAFIVPEINSSGISFVDHIKTKYMNIYRRQVFDKRSNSFTDALGWRTTGTSKPLLVNALEEAVRDEAISINSEECIKECRTFVRSEESGKQGYGAEGSNHDDRVMALGLAYQGIKFWPKMTKPMTVAEKKLKDYIAQRDRELPREPSNSDASVLARRMGRNYSIRKR